MVKSRVRKGTRGRNPIQPKISFKYKASCLVPFSGGRHAHPIHIDLAELEAIRLVDYEDMTQEEAGKLMGVSRGTVWRLLMSGRKKLIGCLVQDQILNIGQPFMLESD